MWTEHARPPHPDVVLRGAIGLVLLVLLASSGLHFALGVDLLQHPGLFLPCPFELLSGWACPGCGMTRALLLLSQLRPAAALAAHPAAPLLLALMVGALLRRRRTGGRRQSQSCSASTPSATISRHSSAVPQASARSRPRTVKK